MCLICGGDKYLENGKPCWGCNYIYCPICSFPIPFEDEKCQKCGTKIIINKENKNGN